jgi:hypothetical protein
MQKSWKPTAIKTATENFGGFSFEKPASLHINGSNLVAVYVSNYLIYRMLQVAQFLVQCMSIGAFAREWLLNPTK